MRYFENGSKISMDACAIEVKDSENRSMLDYSTYNFYGSCTETQADVQKLAMEYPNLRFRTGYGLADACTIDADNKIRYDTKWTNPPERQQLSTRTFVAVPNFGRGTVTPNLETMMIHGTDTSIYKDCHNLAEYTLGWRAPITECTENFIRRGSESLMAEPAIGRPSKDIFMAQRKAAC